MLCVVYCCLGGVSGKFQSCCRVSGKVNGGEWDWQRRSILMKFERRERERAC